MEIYREIIIYHEFIHCLGYLGHNKEFYKLESLWPTIIQKIHGQKFMQFFSKRILHGDGFVLNVILNLKTKEIFW